MFMQSYKKVCETPPCRALFVSRNAILRGAGANFGRCSSLFGKKCVSLHTVCINIVAPIVQWIERRFPKPLIRVRFPVGVPTALQRPAHKLLAVFLCPHVTVETRQKLTKSYWCPVKYWSNIVKRGMSVLYKTSENSGLTFAHCTVCYPLPLKGAHIIG